MPRVAPPQPVDSKLFRHFVIITVVLAALLAVFASGESSEALEQQLAEKREKEDLKAAELELAKKGKGGNTSLVFKDNRTNKSSWGPDIGPSDVTYVPSDGDGSPELVAGDRPSFVDRPNTAGTSAAAATVAPPGMAGINSSEIEKKRKKKRELARSLAGSRRPPPPEDSDEY